MNFCNSFQLNKLISLNSDINIFKEKTNNIQIYYGDKIGEGEYGQVRECLLKKDNVVDTNIFCVKNSSYEVNKHDLTINNEDVEWGSFVDYDYPLVYIDTEEPKKVLKYFGLDKKVYFLNSNLYTIPLYRKKISTIHYTMKKTLYYTGYISNDLVTEILINSILSQAIESKKCQCFTKMYYSSLIYKKYKKFTSIIIMEKIDCTLKNLLDEIENDPEIVENLLIQILFTIYWMQQTYNIVHMDLSYNNVFIKKVSTKVKNFSFKINDNVFSIKNLGYQVKLGDFGYTMKFSEPVIVRSDLININHKRVNLINYYSEWYDILYLISSLKFIDIDISCKLYNYLQTITPFTCDSSHRPVIKNMHNFPKLDVLKFITDNFNFCENIKDSIFLIDM